MNDSYWKKTKAEFRTIFDTINEVYKISNSIIKYIESLDKMYKNLLNYKTNDKNLLYFGLNTFYFQIRFLQSQYEDSKRQFVFLLNHLYSDYYKLYKLIKYHVDCGSDEKLKVKIDLELTFPIYDDLSPYTQYKESDIISLHDFIIKILEIIDNENDEFAKSNSINDLQSNHQNGIPIANFIHGLSHEQSIMEEYISLYKHYLEFFQNFYKDECNAYKNKLEKLFEHIKDHAPLDSNPLKQNTCKIENCSINTYLNTEYCELHYKLNRRPSKDNINIDVEEKEKEEKEAKEKAEKGAKEAKEKAEKAAKEAKEKAAKEAKEKAAKEAKEKEDKDAKESAAVKESLKKLPMNKK